MTDIISIKLTPQTKITVNRQNMRTTIDGVDYRGGDAIRALIQIAHTDRGWAALKQLCGITEKEHRQQSEPSP